MEGGVRLGEAGNVLRRIANGDLRIDGAFDNNHMFFIVGAGGYTMAFFDDFNLPDYLEWIVAPDGRIGYYGQWEREGSNPIEAPLSSGERGRLEERVVAAVTHSRGR